MLTFRLCNSESNFSTDRGFRLTSSICVTGGFSYPGWDDPGEDEVVRGGNPLGDVRRGGRMSPETPAPFGVLLAQDLLLTLALLL